MRHLANVTFDERLHEGANDALFHALRALAGKGQKQYLAGGDFIDAARAQIE